jgi:xanthine dehydrogenase accessory factor
MTMPRQSDILDLIGDYKLKGEPFALATVVRTISVTAAKAGAKAVILADGTITEGWIGGGCARGAVLNAAREALADGQSRLVSIQPDDQLSMHQVKVGELRDGIVYAKNMCPSQGTMDVFVEPVLPRPHLTICGGSPVAIALADLARRMGFFITICAPAADHAGLFYRIAGGIHLAGGNIIDADQHAESESGLFFMRLVWDVTRFKLSRGELDAALEAASGSGGRGVSRGKKAA